MMDPRRLILLGAFFLLAPDPAGAACTSNKCPDQEALDAVRARAAAACDCVTAAGHKTYVQCAREIVRDGVRDGSLSKRCRKAALRCESKGYCGQMTDGFTDSSGVQIHHVSMGEGPLIVMLHGFPDFWARTQRSKTCLDSP